MTKPTIRFGSLVLVMGLLVVHPGSAFGAGLVVTVNFSGSVTSPSAGPLTLTGCFTYEQSHKVSGTSSGVFKFKGASDGHSVNYSIAGQSPVSGSGTSSEPFTITTTVGAMPSPSTLQLVSTVSVGNNVTNIVTIIVPLGTTPDQQHLPDATDFPSSPSAAVTSGSFAVTDSTGTTTFYTGSIAAVIATEQ